MAPHSSGARPVIVGVSQLTVRPSGQGPIVDPLEMLSCVAETAGSDAGGRRVLDAVDVVVSLHLIRLRLGTDELHRFTAAEQVATSGTVVDLDGQLWFEPS